VHAQETSGEGGKGKEGTVHLCWKKKHTAGHKEGGEEGRRGYPPPPPPPTGDLKKKKKGVCKRGEEPTPYMGLGFFVGGFGEKEGRGILTNAAVKQVKK